MLFEKDYPLLATPEQLLDFIKDVEQATTCMPNLERYERISENRLLFVVTPRFSFVRTRLTMEWEIVSIGSKSGNLRLTGKGLGCTFEAQVNLTLTPTKGGSRAHLEIDISVKGILKHVPESVILGAAGTLADEMMTCADAKCTGAQSQ